MTQQHPIDDRGVTHFCGDAHGCRCGFCDRCQAEDALRAGLEDLAAGRVHEITSVADLLSDEECEP